MTYAPKNFQNLLGTPGFSDTLLTTHFGLYEGYVKNTNTLLETLEKYRQEGKSATPEYAELKRRFGWEWNGMRLHEYYFENLSKEKQNKNSALKTNERLTKTFGNFDNWMKDFKASGVMRGIGWGILYCDPHDKKLFNTWVNEHDIGHLAGCTPLFVMDVFEHAYITDYSTKRAEYIDAFFEAINWTEVEKRFRRF